MPLRYSHISMSHLHLSLSQQSIKSPVVEQDTSERHKHTIKRHRTNAYSHNRAINSWKQVQPYSRFSEGFLHYVDCIAHLHLFLESYDNVQNGLGCCRYQLSVIIVIFQGSSSRSQITKSINITFKIYIRNIFCNP